jgi:hypothetical protein
MDTLRPIGEMAEFEFIGGARSSVPRNLHNFIVVINLAPVPADARLSHEVELRSQLGLSCDTTVVSVYMPLSKEHKGMTKGYDTIPCLLLLGAALAMEWLTSRLWLLILVLFGLPCFPPPPPLGHIPLPDIKNRHLVPPPHHQYCILRVRVGGRGQQSRNPHWQAAG